MKKTSCRAGRRGSLAACGGGDDRRRRRPRKCRRARAQSIGRLHRLPEGLVALAADMLEPVDTSNVTPPTDETSEPQTVD